ncbi:penicillin-binding protein PBP1B [Streptococcus iniae]|uniref:Penicillin-binding protein n=1 Tax=Streptococcus iniae TaxID=1346 RepID=A0A3L8GN27_STRIN|nr:penicillin-binding protein PBP1B [Streptococcus iniae]APD31094.1 transglycosylase [Streptococcus iniae]AYB02026.1 penicillin-binding protein [Streptococcus iniae]AYB03893.1 penicillin-binding protein [Streptococcus iniae]ELY5747190.1 penicillin-binding protein [Streptococcus iniae]ELY5749351.1 penicillin-binding protein [Streptococcus iniae]
MRYFIVNQRNKKKQEQDLDYKDLGIVALRTLKLISNFIYIIIFLLGMMGVGMAFGYLASQIDSVKVPSKESLVKQVNAISRISQLNYSDNSIIAPIDSDLLRTPVPKEAISDNIKNALVSTEDENFREHKGVVPKAVFRATLASILGLGESSGGSTLTQQLVKQQVIGDAPTFKRKSKEIIYALALERYLSKDDILSDYLNVSPFGRNNKGQNIAGIGEAARGIFGVEPKDLTIPQAAFLAGLPQSPIVYSPYLSTGQLKTDQEMVYGIKRQQHVLYNMYREGMLSKQDYESYKAYPIKQDFKQPESVASNNHDYLYYSILENAKAAMFDYLIKRDKVSERDLKNDKTKAAYEERAMTELQQGGYTVTSTINKTIYQAMQSAAANYGGLLDDGTGTLQMGNVLTNNANGAVLGFIGGRDYKMNQNNHAFDTRRSPGSSIKPIIAYGPAIDQGLMGSASILSNYPTTYSSGQKIMHVDSEGTAMMPLQEALNTSWNIPAYWTQKLLRDNGVNVEAYMSNMGYHIPDYSIESLPLGAGIDVSVGQQTNAYQMIANNGEFHKQYMVEKITASDGTVVYQHQAKPVRIFSPATATILQELLRGPISSGSTTTFKSRLSAINPHLASADWIGKTGTTENYSDVWLMLATPKVTLGGWAGHDDNSSLAAMTGYHNEANYMANLANAINQADGDIFGIGQRFKLDNSVIKASVNKATGLQAGVVTVNGRKITIGGENTTSLWAKNGPGQMTYKFAIGGTDADYQKAWSSFGGGKK